MLVKGMKKGKIIELLEEVNLPDNQEILISIKEVNHFWSASQKFRAKIEQEGITFDNLRKKSPWREVDL